MALTSFQGIRSLLVEANRPFRCHPSAQRNLSPIRPGRTRCGLTTRSTGAPTAGHQARAGGTRYIFANPGLASHRWRPVSSNVRPRLESPRTTSTRLGPGASPHLNHCLFVCSGLAASLSLGSSSNHSLAFKLRQRRSGKPWWPGHTKIANSLVVKYNAAWPNPSLNRTLRGMPARAGLRHSVHHRSPALAGMPRRSG